MNPVIALRLFFVDFALRSRGVVGACAACAVAAPERRLELGARVAVLFHPVIARIPKARRRAGARARARPRGRARCRARSWFRSFVAVVRIGSVVEVLWLVALAVVRVSARVVTDTDRLSL